jgi:hypothetical protein
MSEKRGQWGFVKVGDLPSTASPQLISGSENMVPAVHEATEQKKAVTAQGRHHFDSARQIDALARIGEDKNPDMGFMTRMLTLCSLPRTDPGDRLQYKRTNGPYKLIMMPAATTNYRSAISRACYSPGSAPRPCKPRAQN